jgi:D-serine deaminase-like pyridoxal phosphate-dependent protein
MMTPYLRYRLGTISKRAHALQTRISAVGKLWAPFLHGGLPLPVLHSISIHTRHASCASINDAQQLAAAGFQSFIVTRPVVDSSALEMLASLTAHHEFTVIVDHFRQAELLSHALIARGSAAQVLLDVDLGRQTTGVRPGPDSVNLATAVSQLPRVHLRGIFLDDRCTGNSLESPASALSFAESLAVARHCQRMIQSSSSDCEPIITAFDSSAEALDAAEVAVVMTSPMQSPEFLNPSFADVSVELVCRVLSRPSLEWCVVNAPCSTALTWTSQTATQPRGATLLHARGDVATFAISGESRDLRIGDELSLAAEVFAANERHNLPFVTAD